MKTPETRPPAPLVQVVIGLPPEIDISNAPQVGHCLTAALRPGTIAVIADMTGTIFCDCSGVRVLLQGLERAAAARTQLRVAAAAPNVLRLFHLLGLDQVLELHPSVAAALEHEHPRRALVPAGHRGAS